MAEGFQYELSAKDEMTSPLKQAKAALAGLKDQLKATEASVKALKDAQARFKQTGMKDEVKASADAIAKMRDKASDLKGQMKDTSASIKELDVGTGEAKESMLGAAVAGVGLNQVLDVGKEVFRKVGEAAMWAAEKIAHFIIETAKMAIEVGAAKEKLTAMYDYFGAGKGQEIFQKLDALGTAIHVPTEKVHEYASDLIQSGIQGQNRLEQSVKSVAMLAKVGGDAAAGKMKSILEETAKTQQTMRWRGGKGMFTITREQLVGTGVTVDQVYAALAKRMKIGTAQVRTQMMMGQITAADGIDALNDVLERGKVGETARSMTGDLSQAFTELKDNIGKILKDVDFKGFIKEVQGFARLFDPMQASGKIAKTVMTDVFNTIFKVAKDTVHFLRLRFLDLEIAGLRLLIFLGPQIKQFKKLWTEMKSNAAIAMVASVAWNELKGVFVAVAFSVKGLMVFINGTMVALNMLGSAVESVMSFGDKLAKKLDMKTFGINLIKDMIDGIKVMGAAMQDAAGDVGNSLKTGFNNAIGRHSPPKFFTDAGKDSGKAFAKGGAEEMGAGGFSKQAPVIAPQGGGGHVFNIDLGGIEINGVKGIEDGVDMFRARLTDELEKIADQLGGKLSAA